MILTVSNLSKEFEKKRVLNETTFSLTRGEIVGLIGPNGSGKTTLLNILTGMLKPTSGFFFFDRNVQVGMSISGKGFFDDMKVTSNLLLYAQLMNLGKYEVNAVMSDFSIDFGYLLYGKLSAGMKQRVSLATAFIAQRDVILLDEPTNHLDVDAILQLRYKIVEMKKRNVSFLITSHVLSDLEKVCDKILFLKNGNLILNAGTSELLRNYGSLEDAYIDVLK